MGTPTLKKEQRYQVNIQKNLPKDKEERGASKGQKKRNHRLAWKLNKS